MTTAENRDCPSCGLDLTRTREACDGDISFCPKCNFPLLLVAGKYRLKKTVGKGAFGTAFLAEHERLVRDEKRVIKILPSEVLSREGIAERFFREVQLTATLSQENEHIVRVYDDFGELPNNLGHFYVMEFLDGEDLTHFLKDKDDLPDMDFCLHIFQQLCEAMQHAHDMGVIHRDLKPDNLFIIKRKKDQHFLKILDFGVARPVNADELKVSGLTQGAVGTAFYMSPEQFTNHEVTYLTDIYSMGTILYEMMIGYTPFNDPRFAMPYSNVEIMMTKMTRTFPNAHRLKPQRVSEALADVILKATATEPQDRYQSALELKDAVERVLHIDYQTYFELPASEMLKTRPSSDGMSLLPALDELDDEMTQFGSAFSDDEHTSIAGDHESNELFDDATSIADAYHSDIFDEVTYIADVEEEDEDSFEARKTQKTPSYDDFDDETRIANDYDDNTVFASDYDDKTSIAGDYDDKTSIANDYDDKTSIAGDYDDKTNFAESAFSSQSMEQHDFPSKPNIKGTVSYDDFDDETMFSGDFDVATSIASEYDDKTSFSANEQSLEAKPKAISGKKKPPSEILFDDATRIHDSGGDIAAVTSPYAKLGGSIPPSIFEESEQQDTANVPSPFPKNPMLAPEMLSGPGPRDTELAEPFRSTDFLSASALPVMEGSQEEVSSDSLFDDKTHIAESWKPTKAKKEKSPYFQASQEIPLELAETATPDRSNYSDVAFAETSPAGFHVQEALKARANELRQEQSDDDFLDISGEDPEDTLIDIERPHVKK